MAFDAFMYIEGKSNTGLAVEGETTDSKFKDKKAFELYSFSFGASNPTTIGSASTGAGGGKVSLSSFNVMKKTDKASSSLFKSCAEGSHFPKAVVTLRKAGGKQVEFIEYTFETVYVDSIQWSGSTGGDDSPTESLSMSYGKFTLKYQMQDSAGSATGSPITTSWNQMNNSPS